MHGEYESQRGRLEEARPWDRVLANATAPDHIVQLYQDQDFLGRAVCRFGVAALANGESFLLASTLTHWNAFRQRLEAEGVDQEAARARGQLTIVDADECLSRFMREAMPDSPVFNGVFGDVAASMNLEDLFDQLGKKIEIAIFCSFLMDNFNGDVHAHMLPRLGTNHSHLIPVEDYARLERAVADALRETVGPDEARVLESRLLSRYRPPFNMPRSQALLLALRQFLPTVADPVLQRSRDLYTASRAA